VRRKKLKSDLNVILAVSVDDWDRGHNIMDWTPRSNQGWRLWWPRRRWYHKLFRIGPRAKFEWREPTGPPEGEPVWIRFQMAEVRPPQEEE
jgi:hypothetical protein